ncbi:hemolysin III family protein [Ectothiorhodospira haloalkaliphila]|uniref:PAQR family membrane homeostasis protein TrhA n=1 Tax=Ectothiorhodospira haloalkaliphila TaxID=421628 RepID=UPI001EE8A1E5|nr:hemolysin III family protein [Ectothiorhodospira haloalkaliphila]MCG5523422.1 hemolysin III family protein [Ectothiorhodospira haloalkaliphila]
MSAASSTLGRRRQTLGEEIANSVSHGAALVAVIVGIPFLILEAVRSGSAAFVVGVSVFSATMVVLYLSSTLYHAMPHGRAKRVFRVVDHSVIFLMIAGTYTPFTLGVLGGPWGWTLFGLVWGLAGLGVLLKSFNGLSHPVLSTGLYLLMGWLVVIAIVPLYNLMPTPGLMWLVAGGLAYTGGVVFYALDQRVRYGHFIWHLFVIAGTVCHYFAILWYGA